MGTTNEILKFALSQKVFTRKELIAKLKREHQIGSAGVFSEQLNRLIKSGQLVRVERGVYTLPDESRPDFSVICTEEMRRIHQQMKDYFPFVNYCLWPASAIVPYMHHVPKLHLLLVDVDREAAESVFNLLNNDSNHRVFLQPLLTDFERYIIGNEAIIIRPLISEAPIKLVDGINTPTIEKVLVDIVGDVEFSFLQGLEINKVYATVFERHNINQSKLLRYAARRGRREKIVLLMNNINV